MKSHNKNIVLLFVLMVSWTITFSQQESGYLFRCYVSTKVEWPTFHNYEQFSVFLSQEDLSKELKDSVFYEITREGPFFLQLFSKLFLNNLLLIDDVPYKKEFVDSSCLLTKTISLSDLAFYDYIYIYKEIEKDFFYIIMVNKIIIDYCLLNQYTEYQLMFKKRISLKSFPLFSKLNLSEIEFLERRFQMVRGLKGEVFPLPGHVPKHLRK